jgi:TonB family protein
MVILSATVPGLANPGANNNGVCPPSLKSPATIPQRATPTPPIQAVHYVGTVTVSVTLSDTGYICGVKVIKGIEPALDEQAVEAIREELFQPIKEDGKPVPGFMTIQRDFWRGNNSDFSFSENVNASPDEIPAEARLARAVDLPSLIASGEVDGKGYSNTYFGVSFTAQDAIFTAPSEVDNQGRNVRLVDAVVRAQKREDRYAISILADRLSNYPDLKSRKDYVEHMTAQLMGRQTGAKRSRDPFPYVISGIEFVGMILQEPDESGTSHFRGMFSTVMKGYILSLDIAATSEQKVLKSASSIEFKQGK